MLNCRVIYNGVEYTHEAFLDFILESGTEKISDIVYDTAIRNRRASQLKVLHTEGTKLKTSKHRDDINADLESETPTEKHQIGVTKFLSGLTVGDSLLFPEFIEENYWNERRKDWQKGEFSIEEKEVLFSKDSNGNYNVNPNIDLLEAETKIKEKWKAQAYLGTAIHKTLELFFKYKKDNSIWQIKDDDKCINLIKKGLDSDSKKLLSDQCILSAIKIGRSIIKQFGETALFFPEFKISGDTKLTDKNDNLQTLVGSIDLVVLDEQGFVHIIDYKTSPLDYINYDSAKELTFEYQLATYEKLLNNKGIRGASVYVSPIKLINFRKESNQWIVDDLSGMEQLVQLSSTTNENIQTNLAKILPDIVLIDDTPEQLAESLDKFKSTYFPEYVASTELNIDKIRELVEEKAEYNESTDKWVYNLYSKSITKDTKEGIVSELQTIFSSDSSVRHKTTINIKNKVKQSLLNIQNTDIPSRIEYNDWNGSDDWINNYLGKYLNSEWEILEGNDITDYHGVILLYNKNTHQIDVVTISTAMLEKSLELNQGKLITGSLQSDIKEESKGNRLAMDGIIGNMELLKTIAVLDHMPGLFNDNQLIGEISVMNPRVGYAITAPNETLFYNYNLLYQTKPYSESSHIIDKNIKFAQHYEIFANQFKEIMTLYKGEFIKDKKWEKFEPSLDILSRPYISNYDKRAALIELRNKMKETWKSLETSKFESFTSPHYRLYKAISLAILETDGIELPQIYQDGEKWLEDVNIFKHGIASLELDNPGNFKDKNLNIITKLVMNAYQNVRDRMQLKIPTIYDAVQKLKDKKDFGFLKERTIGNPTELYKNMITVENGNIYIKNPYKNNEYEQPMTDEEIEFVKFFLESINKNRYPNITFDQVKDNSHHKYFQLPLMKGDIKSDIVMSGIWETFKHKLKSLHPANIVKVTRDENQEVHVERLFEMGTSFDRGEGRDRINYISERTKDLGIGYFELNLETLLFAHTFSYMTKDAINEVFPNIEAITMNIKYSAFTGNTAYKNLTEYIENFINSKIFKKNIDDAKWDPVMAYTKQIMKFASYLALAFNPRQIYQFLEGIWKDIMLMNRSLARGDEAFTFNHLKDSFLSTLPEMIHYTNGRTKWEALNQLYALNDMGVDEYVDRIKSDKYGMWGFFNRIAFHFASRPDFYNRATIFGAQMRKDGCWEAHEWENGILTYNFKKDTRFDAFANNDKSDPVKYNKQKALYLTMAKQMEIDKAVNPDGTLFRMKNPETGEFNPLPKAYTIQQSESLKDVADSIYGYYSSEKKSMIQAHTMGAMIMQMNTYWSAKKNQYFAPGSVKLQGELKIVEGLYLDENGEVTETNTGIPYMRWEGDFQEGIILTLAHFVTYRGNFKERWNQIWNSDDENLRKAYRQNLQQLGYDLFMLFVFGQMIAGGIQNSAKTYVKESDDPFANLTVSFAANVFKQSFVDYDFIDSIFGRGLNWTPFSLTTAEKLLNSASQIMTGDMNAKTAILNTYGLTRELKPFFRTIDRNEN